MNNPQKQTNNSKNVYKLQLKIEKTQEFLEDLEYELYEEYENITRKLANEMYNLFAVGDEEFENLSRKAFVEKFYDEKFVFVKDLFRIFNYIVEHYDEEGTQYYDCNSVYKTEIKIAPEHVQEMLAITCRGADFITKMFDSTLDELREEREWEEKKHKLTKDLFSQYMIGKEDYPASFFRDIDYFTWDNVEALEDTFYHIAIEILDGEQANKK